MSIFKQGMRVQKRLLQFNELPFVMGEITNQSYTSSFKGELQNYTNNTHGSYYPTFGGFGKLNSSEFTATVAISFKDLQCDEKIDYARYIKRQLAKAGKLWAVQHGEEIIYANARVTSINEDVDSIAEKDVLNLSITFELMDGYWVIPTKTRTFICDYCPAKFKDIDPYYCYDANDVVGRCDETGLSKCFPCLDALIQPPMVVPCDPKPLCNYNRKELANMFGGQCINQYYIQHSCKLERDYFCDDVSWGRKFRLRSDAKNNNNVTRVVICSKTDLPTDFLRIRVWGGIKKKLIIRKLDPAYVDYYREFTANEPVAKKYVLDSVTIGTDKKKYTTDVDTITTLGYGVKAYYSENFSYPDKDRTNIDPKMIKRTNTPFFTIEPGINVFEIQGNMYDEDAWVYFSPIEITY